MLSLPGSIVNKTTETEFVPPVAGSRRRRESPKSKIGDGFDMRGAAADLSSPRQGIQS